jgi:hypothetical protein
LCVENVSGQFVQVWERRFLLPRPNGTFDGREGSRVFRYRIDPGVLIA